jgi:hypothetical protein
MGKDQTGNLEIEEKRESITTGGRVMKCLQTTCQTEMYFLNYGLRSPKCFDDIHDPPAIPISQLL